MKPVKWLISMAEATFTIDSLKIIDKYESLKTEFEKLKIKSAKMIEKLNKQSKKERLEKD